MKLHENRELFADAVTITAQQMNLPEIYVEKDYWVTLALQRIFTSPLAEYTVLIGCFGQFDITRWIGRGNRDISMITKLSFLFHSLFVHFLLTAQNPIKKR